MNYRAGAASPIKCRLYFGIDIGMATYAMAVLVLLLSGCGSSSESPNSESSGMNNPNVSTAELDDPNGEIAKLVFGSDTDDAIYQCLLSAAMASSATRGLQAYPVIKVDRADPIYAEGIYANWCKTVGAGGAVDTDIASCGYLNGGFSAPGTEVLQLIASPVLGTHNGDEIGQIELKSIKIPEQGSTDFQVEYRRIRVGDENVFSLFFCPLTVTPTTEI